MRIFHGFYHFMRVQPSVDVVLGNHLDESPRKLYITSRKLIWLSDVDMAKSYDVDFLSISLHAVSRDPDAYSSPCIYTQIEVVEDEDDESDTKSTEVLDLSKIRELRLVPSDSSQLDTLFDVFCECDELNPEPIEGKHKNIHNWVLSADQMNVHGGGKCKAFVVSRSWSASKQLQAIWNNLATP